jgi:hypothetical protein
VGLSGCGDDCLPQAEGYRVTEFVGTWQVQFTPGASTLVGCSNQGFDGRRIEVGGDATTHTVSGPPFAIFESCPVQVVLEVGLAISAGNCSASLAVPTSEGDVTLQCAGPFDPGTVRFAGACATALASSAGGPPGGGFDVFCDLDSSLAVQAWKIP